jgi:hypothetical protein
MSTEHAIVYMILAAGAGLIVGLLIGLKQPRAVPDRALTKDDLDPLRKAARELHDIAKGQSAMLDFHNPNVAIGEAAMNARLETPEERGVEVYYVDGPNGIKVQQFRPMRQEQADLDR